MPDSNARNPLTEAWPGLASAALRVAFGVIWAMDAALTWTSGFAAHYVGYLHNASHGQPGWSAWWFDMWIALVTPRAELFVWLTRSAETALALALILGFARKSTYLVGTLFSLLIWSTAEGFGGPYTVGATNMGTAISYVLIFIALIVIDHRAGPNPYSIDYLIERRWPRWRRIAEWNRNALPQPAHRLSWRAQASALGGIALLLVLLLAGLHSALNVKSPSPVAAAAAVSPLSLASSQPMTGARDARLPPLAPGDSLDVHIESNDHSVEIASGVEYQAWTFG
jgi:nitrite reductase (NO-forming)